jgi:hypothetical protein
MIAVTVGLGGCATPGLSIEETVGMSLPRIDDHVAETSTLLVQDVSPRVGEDASYSMNNQSAWVVVASCADAVVVDDASETEVAVIPERTYTDDVREQIADGAFADAVACDGLSYR